MMAGNRSATMTIDLAYTLFMFVAYTACGWIALCGLVRFINSRNPPGRRIGASLRSTIGGLLALFVGIFAWHAVGRPPGWRSLLYEETFDACRDGNIARVRVWLWLGASPDGGSDYAAGPPVTEFRSHVDLVADKGNHRLLQLLLEEGGDPNLGSYDSTPLSNAVHNHDAESVKLLLAHGADPRHGYGQGDAADHAGRLKFHDLVPLIRPYLSQH